MPLTALRLTARLLLRHKSFSLINILGLAIGLSACLLLYLYVQFELSYDAYNDKAARIVRVTSILHSPESDIAVAGTPAALAPALLRDCPEVEAAVRLEAANLTIRQGGEMVTASDFYFSDQAVFSVFSFSFLEGSPKAALTTPNSIVLTRSAATFYLGPGPAIGRTLLLNGTLYHVTAVIKNRPANSDITINALLSKDFSAATWTDFDVPDYTFLLFRTTPDLKRFNTTLPGLTTRYTQPELDRQGIKEYRFYFEAEKLADVHFSKGKIEDTTKGNRSFLTVFSVLAVFILVIALLNYINLSTVRSVERAKEVAVRKVIGARPGRLIRQFLAESAILMTIAWVIAFALVLTTIPVFNRLLSTRLSFGGWPAIVFLLLLFPLITLLAGGYPAFVLSRYSPIKALKNSPEKQGISLRKLLTITQFVIALAMLTGTMVIYCQMQFIAHKDLGANREGVLTINIPADSAIHAGAPAFIQTLRRESGIHDISVGSGLPAEGVQLASTTGYTQGKQRILMVNYFFIDPRLLPMLHIQLVAGRNFSDSLQTDKQESFIVNQTFVRTMGWKTGLGETLEGSGNKGKVIGVVKDFFFKSLHNAIEPMVMIYKPDPQLLAVLLKTSPQTLPRLRQLWKTHFPTTPFNYYFLDENFAAQYAKDRLTMTLFNAFTALAIFICFIGLYGLVSLLVLRRTKEIGIRKVLGASLPQLIALLTTNLLVLVGVAAAIALPLAAIGASRWLNSYAYHVGLSAWVFAAPLAFIVILTLTVTGSRILRAALANPVKSLRTE